jgi:hypothetical protein
VDPRGDILFWNKQKQMTKIIEAEQNKVIAFLFPPIEEPTDIYSNKRSGSIKVQCAKQKKDPEIDNKQQHTPYAKH